MFLSPAFRALWFGPVVVIELLPLSSTAYSVFCPMRLGDWSCIPALPA